MSFTDQLGREITLNGAPQSIISLVPSISELLVDLGLEDHLVGVTKFCEYPAYLRKTKTIVGGTKQVDYDKIKSLSPDLIICNKEENTLEMLRELDTVASVYVSDVRTLEDACTMIQDLGEICGVQQKSIQLIDDINSAFDYLKVSISKKPTLKVAYFIWKDPWMVAGGDTFIQDMLEHSGFENLFDHQERYPEVSIAQVKDLNPDLLLFSSEPFPFQPKFLGEVYVHFPKEKIVFVDGSYFSWYGSRLLRAATYFKKLRDQLA
ncbi:helical backbone metal receptor [Gangjinia marincola]|uniref:Helical backbone metal receptor n=1 Tax=Gangjinia marincola TaxID=578463 RepID=A0ABN1MJP0_9FLAO